MPAAYRRRLDSGALVVTALDQCLAVYPAGEWARLERQLAALPAFDRQVKALTRLLLSRACDCELDGQGRILLPASLRAAASLGGEAVLIGALSRFEVWSPAVWEQFLRDSERLLDDLTLDVRWPLPPTAGPLGGGPAPLPARSRRPQAKPKR